MAQHMIAKNGTWNGNGLHYVGICRACRVKGVGQTSNQRLAMNGPMSKMTLGQRHLSTPG